MISYALALFYHPLLGSSPLAIACLWCLFTITMAVVFFHPSLDLLDPFRLVSLTCLLVYCVSPLFAESWSWAFREDPSDLLGRASGMVLASYLMIAVGYHMGSRLPEVTYRREARLDPPAPLLVIYSAALFALGVASYLLLVVLAGGFDRMLGGAESRSEFFEGIGVFYRVTMFIYSGGALYFAIRVTRRSRFPSLAGWPLVAASLLFLPLQGRSRVIHAAVIFAVIYHYRIRPIPIRWVAIATPAAFALFLFVGHARSPDIRPLLLTQPLLVVRDAAVNAPELVKGNFGDTLNRVKQVMLVLDNYPEVYPHRWGSTLLLFVNPVLRQVGLEHLQVENIGTRILKIAQPWQPEWVQSGLHPSLIGELLANFPWYLVLPVLMGYGVLLRFFYRRLVLTTRNPVRLALYAALLFRLVDTIIVGVGQVLFETLVIAVPILVAELLLPGSARAPELLPGESRADLASQ